MAGVPRAARRPPDVEELLLRLPRRGERDVLVSVDWREGWIAFAREGDVGPALVLTARDLPAVLVALETMRGRGAFVGV